MLDKKIIASEAIDVSATGVDTGALSALYTKHVGEKLARFQALLNDTSYSAVVISSGSFKAHFQDDLTYPFKANPYFKEWLPLNKRRDAFLVVEAAAEKPILFFGLR